METSISLLNHFTGPDSTLAKMLGVRGSTISMARKQGRLSPELAARAAATAHGGSDSAELAKEVQKWVAIAAIEQLPDEYRRRSLFQLMGYDVDRQVAWIDQKS